MLVHSVYFWLKADLDAEARTRFRTALDTLKGIDAAEAVYLGASAPTPPRPVIESSYDFALTVLLKDMDAHDRYQEDPLHQAFLKAHKADWEKVQIFDFS